ncbi:MAG: DUF4153 domain-containing protein [Calditrichaeota bacterium]|nr:MAG: DUF4153 domain-containing protein [Calditrichota bacterium]
MLRLPSLDELRREAVHTVKRFPLTLLCALVGTVAMLNLIEEPPQAQQNLLLRVLLTALLGVPFSIALIVAAERWSRNVGRRLLVQLGGAVLLAGYFSAFPTNLTDAPAFHFIRLAILLVGAHLLVAVAPYLRKGEINGFWQYNKTLFLRILIALFYSHVLYLGLVIALVSIDVLFGVNIPGKRFPQLYVTILGMFNTWYFLAGVPEDWESLEKDRGYPGGLRVFSQFILLPLVGLYLLILYAYEAKIILEWNWPKGWVAYLVLGFSIAGILALLLVYPLRNDPNRRWVQTFWRWYYVALIPPVIMLFLGILRRLSDYGFTERRYIVLVLALWLAGMVGYFIFSKAKSIKVIPGTLGLLAFLISVGPWGAFAVSKHSQLGRLEKLFSQYEMLPEDSRLHPLRTAINSEAYDNIYSILNYLLEVHGEEALYPWLPEEWRSALDSASTVSQKLHALLTLTALDSMRVNYKELFYLVDEGRRRGIPVSGFNVAVFLMGSNWVHTDEKNITFPIGRDSLQIQYDLNHWAIQVTGLPESSRQQTLPLTSLKPWLLQNRSLLTSEEYGSTDMPPDVPTPEYRGKDVHLRLHLHSLNGYFVAGDSVAITDLEGTLLLKMNPPPGR